MKNFKQEGDTITVTAPYAVDSGDGFQVGSHLFGVAAFTAASGASVEMVREGVYTLDKVSAQAWSVGALIYWDDSAKNATTTATGSNIQIGVAVAAAANPSSTGKLVLTPDAN